MAIASAPGVDDVNAQVGALGDIKPQTPVRTLDRSRFLDDTPRFTIEDVAVAVGMAPTFVRKVVGAAERLAPSQVLRLLDQDCYSETLVPRSGVLDFLIARHDEEGSERHEHLVSTGDKSSLLLGHSLDFIRTLPMGCIQTVVTSTPYWGMRIYKDSTEVTWGDGERAAYGHEQTPEGFLRHTSEILAALWDALSDDGSVWWNVMDTFNTRTQIRGNAREALNAMQGNDDRAWGDHEARRYSAGHSFLLDGDQCIIPARIAERASRMGFYVKSVITWAKPSTLPEPQNSRVSRSLEYVLHLSKVRTPRFNKDAYRSLPAGLGGRNARYETDKLSDVWTLATSAGRDGHGAQFPLSLPARCIALTSSPDDLVLDPFVGSGNSGVAAVRLGRRFLGMDVSPEYLALAKIRIEDARSQGLQGDLLSGVSVDEIG